ncbi:MAPEG family protein [Methylocella sp. CPCC 101449]|uniref:MAPEG family protein n=1 Tax=Methylocella sp. CPCC 101449 TaxID=2987531 RepID=UPI00288D629C|nr:MAPEG family protein [Methylocella sp. CPCC 101449]MDT2022307.1 MAPEG family protein [Methylocella sp. CPCC 101449]
MSVQAILLPVFAYVLLVLIILIELGRRRGQAVKAGEVGKDASLRENAWPDRVTQVSNDFRNQFEIPVLFLALVAFAMFTRKADLLFVVLSWVFVISRYVHAFIHTTSNSMVPRLSAYFIGVVVLMVMWIIFAVQILLAV